MPMRIQKWLIFFQGNLWIIWKVLYLIMLIITNIEEKKQYLSYSHTNLRNISLTDWYKAYSMKASNYQNHASLNQLNPRAITTPDKISQVVHQFFSLSLISLLTMHGTKYKFWVIDLAKLHLGPGGGQLKSRNVWY